MNNSHLSATLTFLRTLAEEGYWGTISIKLEGGKVVHIVRQESIIPSKLILKEQPEKQNDSLQQH